MRGRGKPASTAAIAKPVRDLARTLRSEHGWEIVTTGRSSHVKWLDADGQVATVTQIHPGERNVRNTVADVRRAARIRGIEL